ncbi:MAG: hypothetical protein IPJ04_17630 [Candidatus Eisenbacteria bacterium]|nr:hypothetical protein [Candidatus Eisenbacteria bacterium]
MTGGRPPPDVRIEHPGDHSHRTRARARSRRALQLVDVRRPEAVNQGRIDLLPLERFVNILGSQLLARTNLGGTGIDPELRTVAVCGHGNSSKQATEHLRALGVDAVSLRGGMAAWMNLVVERALPAPRGLDHLLQFDRIGKGSLAYLLVRGGEALVVDPPRLTAPITTAAARLGARITAVADTHVHADYVSGGERAVPHARCALPPAPGRQRLSVRRHAGQARDPAAHRWFDDRHR